MKPAFRIFLSKSGLLHARKALRNQGFFLMSRGLSLRNLAAKLEISPVYMSNIETDRKPAPTQEKLDKLVDILGLGQYEAEQLLDLAAKSKNRQVSADLPEYIMERDIVRVALRTAMEVDATDAEWQEFIDRITRRGK